MTAWRRQLARPAQRGNWGPAQRWDRMKTRTSSAVAKQPRWLSSTSVSEIGMARAHARAVNVRRRFRATCGRSPSAARLALAATLSRSEPSAVPGRIPSSFSAEPPNTGSVDSPRTRCSGKGHFSSRCGRSRFNSHGKAIRSPPCSVASAISGKRYRNVSRYCVTIRYKVNCE
jgi:hypothetical protein